MAKDLAMPLNQLELGINMSIPKVAIDDSFQSPFNDWLMLLENHLIELMESHGIIEGNYSIVEDINYGLPNAVMIRRDALSSVGGFDMDVNVLQRLRAIGKSKGAIVNTAHIYHNSTTGFLNYRKKLVTRLMFHSTMSGDMRSKYFVSTPIQHSPYGNPARSIFSYTLVSIIEFCRSRDSRWLWGLAYPLLIVSVILPHLLSAMHLLKSS